MSKVSAAGVEFREMDELAAQESAIHALHPLIKLLVTLAYIIVVVSFPKYALSGLSVMVLYPILIFQASGIPVRTCFHKLRVVMPLVCAVGLLNPFFDRVPLLYLGNLAVSGGVISMITLMLKGIFSLMASFLLVATTKMDALCAALRENILARRWMCGFPEKLVIVTVGDYIVSVFGHADPVDTFTAKLAAAYPNAKTVSDDPIV